MIEPLTAMLKDIDGRPVTLLRTAKGKTVAAVYDDDYVGAFLYVSRCITVGQKYTEHYVDPELLHLVIEKIPGVANVNA